MKTPPGYDSRYTLKPEIGVKGYGTIALAFLSGMGFMLIAAAVNGGNLDLFGSVFRPWAWNSPWSIACLGLATIWGLLASSYLARSRGRDLEHEYLARRLNDEFGNRGDPEFDQGRAHGDRSSN